MAAYRPLPAVCSWLSRRPVLAAVAGCLLLQLYLSTSIKRLFFPSPSHEVFSAAPALSLAAASAIASDSVHRLQHATVERLDLLPYASDVESTATLYLVYPPPDRSGQQRQPYNLCTFRNVCLTKRGVEFQVSDERLEQMELPTVPEDCTSTSKFAKSPWCTCFWKMYRPEFAAPSSSLQYKPEHVWSINKFDDRHHIGHWTSNLVMVPALYSYQSILPENVPVDGIVFHNTPGPITDHMHRILNVSLTAAWNQPAGYHPIAAHLLTGDVNASGHIMYTQELDSQPRVCYKQVSTSRELYKFARRPADLLHLRQHIARYYDIPHIQNVCPPTRIVVLHRHNRRILNVDSMMELISNVTNKPVELLSISAANTSVEQAQLFASSGIIIAPHSSQLVNVLFSPLNGVVIEATHDMFNIDAGLYAQAVGAWGSYALGGEVVDPEVTKESEPEYWESFDAMVAQCGSNPHCLIQAQKKFWKPTRKFNKANDFHADLDNVKQTVIAAMHHLDRVCGLDGW